MGTDPDVEPFRTAAMLFYSVGFTLVRQVSGMTVPVMFVCVAERLRNGVIACATPGVVRDSEPTATGIFCSIDLPNGFVVESNSLVIRSTVF